MSGTRRGLGRGLGALIPEQPAPGAAPAKERPHDVFFASSAAAPEAPTPEPTDDGLLPVPGATFAHIDPREVTPNPRQPRAVFDEDALAELVGSIKEIGVLQPIVVRRKPDGGYELIMGERRLRASKEAGIDAIPAIVRDTDDVDMLRDALVENLHRSQLNPLEEAAAYQQLLEDFGITHEQLASKISRSRPQISNTLRLLKLPPVVQRRVAAGVLSAGHARALLSLEDPAAMEALAQRIVAEGLSVRATEEAVTLGVDKPRAKRGTVRSGGRTEALDDLASRLGDRFDTRVKVALGKSKGRITIEFATVDDLNRIIHELSPEDPGVLAAAGTDASGAEGETNPA
ncbi:ParB/RepB/Spo0J family partition protein [Demequina sp. NBRC 110051]|uniref:ParB/RepB/Spo0J family partition protein n=1 Tax=Demequina sp. NBRC 110051 TaxID=1570340 RepID=UPI000A012930|nr:ParB/RepB/Spo0J family partition protein [Demequina sp. NBRC 110051]